MIDWVDAAELTEVPLFAGLPPEQVERMAGVVHRTTVPAGTLLISAQVPGEAVYFILEGSVRAQLVSEDGAELTVALLGPGDMLGEMSFVPGRPRGADVITRETTTLLWMERKAFMRSLELSPALGRRLIADLSARLQALNERLHAFATLDVTGRVARQILELAERYGKPAPGEGVRIPLPVTQGEIAELVAATRERVNQIVGRLKKSEVLSVDPEYRMVVHRPDVLAELSRF